MFRNNKMQRRKEKKVNCKEYLRDLDPKSQEFKDLCNKLQEHEFDPKYRSVFGGDVLTTLDQQLRDLADGYFKYGVWSTQKDLYPDNEIKQPDDEDDWDTETLPYPEDEIKQLEDNWDTEWKLTPDHREAIKRQLVFVPEDRKKIVENEYILITDLEINGLESYNRSYVKGKLGINPPHLVSYQNIRNGIKSLYSSGNFSRMRIRRAKYFSLACAPLCFGPFRRSWWPWYARHRRP